MTVFNYILFWIALVLSVVTVYKMLFLTKKEDFAPREIVIPKKTYIIIIAVTTLVAVFVRLYQFGAIPGGFNQDGAMAAVDANALAHYGTDRFGMRFPVHFTAWGYGQMSVLLSYLMTPFIKLFGLSVITARLPQLIVSLLGLVCLYFLVRDAFNKNAALVVYIFAAINPWHILQSRWALDCNLYPHFFLFGIFFLNLALKGKHRYLYLIISMFMFGLCMYCYGISIYTMPVFLVIACAYLLITKRIKVREAIIAAVSYLFVAWPFIMVMAINFFKWDTIETPLFTMPYFPNSVRSNDILFFSDNIISQLVTNFKAMLNITVFQTADSPWNNIADFGTIYLFSFPFAVTGFIAVIKEFRKKAGAILVLCFLFTGVWCGLITNFVNINRLNIIYYPIIILAGIGIYEVIRYISIPHLEYGVAAVYLVAFVLFFNTYFTTYAEEMNDCFFDDFGNAVSSLKDSDADKLYITADSQFTGASAVSEILTMFYHDIDAEYFQGKTTPDGELPYSEKYIFESIGNIDVDATENAAYVVTEGDLGYFDSSIYEFTQFGNYYAVTKR